MSLSQEQQARFIQGHDAEHRPAHAWDLDALAEAIAQTHELRADAGPGMHIGLAWLHVDKGGYYWHNGGTGGFSSYAFFDPKNDCAGIVLFNTTVGDSFADLLGTHVRQRLVGEAAVSLR